MTDYSSRDVVVAEVCGVDQQPGAEGRCQVRLQRRHRDYRARRYWSHCEWSVWAPARAAITVGAKVRVVLGGVVTEARPAPEPGYSCKLSPAVQAPVMMPPRSPDDRTFAGLIQREEPPTAGAVVFHMGSGLTCFPECSPPLLESLAEGEWWELQFAGGLEALLLEPVSTGC